MLLTNKHMKKTKKKSYYNIHILDPITGIRNRTLTGRTIRDALKEILENVSYSHAHTWLNEAKVKNVLHNRNKQDKHLLEVEKLYHPKKSVEAKELNEEPKDTKADVVV